MAAKFTWNDSKWLFTDDYIVHHPKSVWHTCLQVTVLSNLCDIFVYMWLYCPICVTYLFPGDYCLTCVTYLFTGDCIVHHPVWHLFTVGCIVLSINLCYIFVYRWQYCPSTCPCVRWWSICWMVMTMSIVWHGSVRWPTSWLVFSHSSLAPPPTYKSSYAFSPDCWHLTFTQVGIKLHVFCGSVVILNI